MESSVLIIEDETVVCDLLTRFLETRHYQVVCAQTLTDGLEKAKAFKPSIVLMDNNLPDGKGVDYISQIKDILPNIRIIVLSAMDSAHVQAIEKGAERFIRKPFGFRQIENAIQA
ncbi:response regulator [Cytophagaceae bacterium DM2B3-1]|uniref:Response regulator n=2 Tax=Xanthocytophaga TaxID=3078918 RepID=A0AAE3UDJ6_9BACT|nr:MULTISPECIES: response regulator [Xanthocytophaga]MDJ1471800.1 response regulator [Xanthocytophaga flavus]MDJ1485854.1 response regulator [Xanthocytophaga flavus]MDJ1497176.1 response regulator [Xanthocytophaga flavus]MDJ1500248.1 response regulator [Xanthocytophaga agilis]